VLPALAVADALRARGVSVTFAGSPDRAEARLVPDAGYELDTFRISGLPRKPGPALARALLLAGRAPLACLRILARRRPHVVLGGGGFVAGPMVLAAWRRRIPAALTEADARLGLANRLAAPFAHRVFLAYPIAGRDDAKYRVTGRPIPARSRALPRDEARAAFDLPPDGPVLGVFGALAGARALNELAVEAFGAEGPPILHVAGERDFASLEARVARPDYRLIPSTDRFGAALGAVDLALSRAGGTVWELAAAGVPAVLVPYPHATGDHQFLNASHFEGGAVVVREAELGRVPALLRELLDDGDRLGRMGDAMRRLSRPDAAETIAEELVALAA
jgi:UDP-N-acetylglucosamine--N-acetylmuramyl-(pentapeptide) pyrophosphoryl-undecaprenol N-acetylglucosamine transferase